MTERVKVRGLKELDAALAEMGKVAGFKALRMAMMASSRGMFQQAKQNALAVGIRGRDAGASAAAMSRSVRKINNKRTQLQMGPKSKHKKALALYNAYHGTDIKRLRHFHMVEFGTYKDPAQPFMRPAFISKQLDYVNSLRDNLKASIEKVRRKAAAQARNA